MLILTATNQKQPVGTGDGRRWRSRRDSDSDDDVEEGHPTDNGDVRAEGEATFCQHPVRVRGLFVRCG